ncbi:hypothetical protein DLM45_00730 [Hyphomicrobium methylovorum]|uniref:acyltransferase family protein n=1 Tax=Hyphomicrobium methylovorum TaxID=84 RepID=UPI0015E76293|nr:acyltransferase family protein [Hyphomicrobium methylovorum]MBA2124751.1 hypothetical protein [Hyphomicrobium methylovorum]
MIGYRADIDGLRALAVALVILFHAKLGFFSGGFIGVDVFFVISGYLIASIISRDVAEGRFSIAQFYARRARRILPALFVVIIASAIAAMFILVIPQDLLTFAYSVRATLLFYSNFFFSRAGDYFQPALETQPMLHTWSLGVEEQFYLIAPLLLAPLLRSRNARGWLIFAAIFAIFLWLSQRGVLRGGTKAFYWPHARAFELMIGVALASPFIRPLATIPRAIVGIAGVSMILTAAIMFTAKTPFPGLAALLPTVGTALVIWSGLGGGSFVSRGLSVAPMVFVGKISYPLYLWHWPIFVFASLLPEPFDSPADRVGLIALAVVCATLTYYFIEKPIRTNVSTSPRGRPFVLGTALASTAVALIPVQALIASGGWKNRFGPEVAAFTSSNPTELLTPGLCSGDPQSWGTQSNCLIGDTAAPTATFVLWGDSHGRVLAPAVSAAAKSRGLKGYFISRGGCAPLVIANLVDAFIPLKCVDAADQTFALLKSGAITHVIVAARWAGYIRPPTTAKDEADLHPLGMPLRTALGYTLERLLAFQPKITLVGPIPEPLFDVPRVMTRAMIDGKPHDASLPRAEFNARNGEVLQILKDEENRTGVRVLYPHQALCNEIACAASGDGYALYVDDNHLSPRGVARLGGLIERIFEEHSAVLEPQGTKR